MPDQSSVALKPLPETISAADSAVKNALAPGDEDKAFKLNGKRVSIVGVVDSVYSPRDHDIVFLDFDKDFQKDIAVVALSSSFSKLPDLKTLEGKRVFVSGDVTLYKQRPEIVLSSPDQIKIVK